MNGDATDLTPEEWQQYRDNARRALHSNPKDNEALEAIRQANTALSAYDEAEAASPGERIGAGFRGGLAGLGQAALDLASPVLHPIQTAVGIGQTIAHPIEAGKTLARAITSDDPATVARGVGNIGTLLSGLARGGPSFARTGGPLSMGEGPIAAVSGARALGRAVRAPFRAGRAIVEGKELSNQLLRARIAELAQHAVTGPPQTAGGVAATEAPIGGSLARRVGPSARAVPVPPVAEGGELPVAMGESSPEVQAAVRDITQAQRDFEAGKISQEDLETAQRFARGEPLTERAQPITPGPPGSGKPVEPIAGTYGGHTVEGPPTPAPPTAPTAAEMVTGRSNLPAAAAEPPRIGMGTRAVPGATPVLPRAIANSYQELEQLIQKGIPREQIKVNYFTRGGQTEQSVPPKPLAPSEIGGSTPTVMQLADRLEGQLALAHSLGQEPSFEALGRQLQRQGVTPKQIQGVIRELTRRSSGH